METADSLQSGPGDITDAELELIQIQMAQKPMLRAEVYARALCASQNVKRSESSGARAMRLMGGRGVGESSLV